MAGDDVAGDEPVPIRTPDQRLRVFVSSTLSELAAERTAVRTSVEQLRLIPVMFELGARPHPPRALYRAYLEQSDVFIGIYWQAYGWTAPGAEISGLEDEYLLSAGLPRLVYLKRPAPDMEPALADMLGRLRSEADTSYRPFTTAEELRTLVADDLALLLTERFTVHSRGAEPHLVGVVPPPSPVTRLVGRDAEVEHLVDLVRAGTRLVTLTGVGGIGKTRLAIAVCERLREEAGEPAAFADLSLVTDPALVPMVIARSVGVGVQGNEPALDAIVDRLRTWSGTLLLDNVEQVVDAAPAVAELLHRCPHLRVLATSRIPLRIRGEQEWVVPPLAVTATDGPASSAITLFLERARQIRPARPAEPADLTTIRRLCAALDGIPLALELAAANLRVLTPAQLLERLQERLELTAGAYTDLPDRQRTLSSTIRWSHDLLDPGARRLFARLSVLSGPFTLESAVRLLDGDGRGVLDELSTLVEHSLLSTALTPDGRSGFAMLETVRAYARQALDRSGETDAMMERLQRLLIDVLAQAPPQLHGPDQADALQRLDAHEADLRATLDWLLTSGRSPGPLVRATMDCWVWLQIRAHPRSFPDLAGLLASESARVRLPAEDVAAMSALQAGRLFTLGRFPEAVAFLDRHLDDHRAALGDRRWALMLNVRAASRAYAPGGPSRREFEEAIGTLRVEEEPVGLGYTLSHYGDLLLLDGDVAAAMAAHTEAHDIATTLGDVNLRAEATYHLALDAAWSGQLEAGTARLAVALRHYAAIDHRDGLSRCLAVAAAIAGRQGDPERAAQLFGCSETVRDTIELPVWPMVAELEGQERRQVRAHLGAQGYDAARQRGRGLDPTAVVRELVDGPVTSHAG